MVSSIHDFTDSEGSDGAPQAVQPDSELIESVSGREPSEISMPTQESPTRPEASTENHSLRVTLRPHLSHIVNGDPKLDPPDQQSDRSTLSPPPPITLRLGLKPTTVDKAVYSSSSSDEDDLPSKGRSVPSSKQIHPPPVEWSSSLPAQHRKSYDWLQPSSAAASHHGPPERSMQKIMGWAPSAVIGGEGKDAKEKKSLKRRSDGASVGPGKAWRKGLKKGMPMPREEGVSLASEYSHGVSNTTPSGRDSPLSLEETPDLGMETSTPHDPSLPFVLADQANLGFPVFSKPIAIPKLNLGPFPKVTPFFAPNNGGDLGAFPRKEKVRKWKHSARTIVGVGGGSLKFRTWTKGPPSELGRLIQADKKARDIARAKPKANAPAEMPLANFTTAPWDRPPMPQAVSSENASSDQRVEQTEDAVDSEVGDPDQSVADIVKEGGVNNTPNRARNVKGGRAKPRKSKLAQEIQPEPEPEPEPDLVDI
ncbi:MAG: hypothetical protein TREMPRED_005010 [Tremellales sp. Tagirdzhanova-0007]|nr:MAG: hypothetical protein TREMPRED_005010 [Tremellales sp. Tagirdzhanova-0007]